MPESVHQVKQRLHGTVCVSILIKRKLDVRNELIGLFLDGYCGNESINSSSYWVITIFWEKIKIFRQIKKFVILC